MNIAELLVGFGAQVAQDVRTDNPTTDGYVRAVARLMQHASKWAAVSASGIKCATHFKNPIGELHLCGTAAIGACVACGQATCFSHAMISPADGQIVCYGCVGVAQKMAQKLGHQWREQKQPPPQPRDRPSSSGPRCTCRFPWECDPKCPVPAHSGRAMRAEHLDTLGLDDDANWDQVRAAFKKLALKYHPDRGTTARARSRAESKFKKISEAFEWLKANKESEAA
jgi:hypothetical protein